MEYRHELKFWVSDLALTKLKYRLEPLMRHDDYQPTEFYRIRSLYFDDLWDSCLSENEAGVDDRRKFRIRYYNENLKYINLEKKSKKNGMTKKDGEILTLDQVREYMAGTSDLTAGPVSTELFVAAQNAGMKPKCIVEYDRCAFVEDVGNVRITFDCNVRGTDEVERFLDFSEDFMIPAMEPGFHVLEVKYDEFLPTYLREAVDLNSLHRQSISKYGLVRQAIKKGGLI